jgi:mannose-6-phosphate isomerase
MKVIAADQPLSLQAHPDAAEAVAGFEREEQAGLPLSAPTCNYRDRRHKPQIVVALEPFEALAETTRSTKRRASVTDCTVTLRSRP